MYVCVISVCFLGVDKHQTILYLTKFATVDFQFYRITRTERTSHHSEVGRFLTVQSVKFFRLLHRERSDVHTAWPDLSAA